MTMPPKIFIKDMTVGNTYDSLFGVGASSLGKAKNGENFLKATLVDKTGSLAAIMFSASQDDLAKFKLESIVRVEGNLETYMDGLSFVMRKNKIQKAEENEYSLADFVPSSKLGADEIKKGLNDLISSIKDDDYKALLKSVFKEEGKRFVAAPGAVSKHHAWMGGLAEHTISICALCDAVSKLRNELDRDLLVTGALLHDTGKMDTYDVKMLISRTNIGKLCDHIVMSVSLVDRHIRGLAGFPKLKREKLLHLLVSHHGLKNHGSPVEPKTAEAHVLHFMDNMDAKVTMILDKKADADEDGWVNGRKGDDEVFVG